jgi:head-tail adaptor
MGGANLHENTVVAEVWGAVEAFTGLHDGMLASEITSIVTHRITIRNPGFPVLSKMQVWFQGPPDLNTKVRQFEIQAVLNPDERNKMLYLFCVEINESQQQDTSSAPLDLE